VLLCLMFAMGSGLSMAFAHPTAAPGKERQRIVITAARLQGPAIPDEKSSRTAAQKKIDSQLLYALKQRRGETRGVPTERIDIELDQKGRALIDITAKVSPQVTARIRKLGGIVISEDPYYHAIRARLALEKLEGLAALKEVSFIAPPAQALYNRIKPD